MLKSVATLFKNAKLSLQVRRIDNDEDKEWEDIESQQPIPTVADDETIKNEQLVDFTK
jgi:hypothetical protein